MSIVLNGWSVRTDQKYPDGTFSLRLSDDAIAHAIHRGAVIDWRYACEEELVVIIYMTRHLRDIGIKPINLRMPYVPNARLDRVKSDHEVFTLKYFCEIINSLNFDVVTVLDPHSSVSCALLDRVNIVSPADYINSAFKMVSKAEGISPLLFYPDEGAMKRYSSDIVKGPYAFGIKKRDWETGKITALEIHGESPSGKCVLMIDDICSRGGTFYHSALALKRAGAANIYIYVTHCENTISQGELLKGDLIKQIYTTDSIFDSPTDKITVL